jgi:putative membrane protein
MNRLLAGTLSGFAATFPMTMLMQILHRWPTPERDSLPPQQITEKFAARLSLKKHLDKPQLTAVVFASHFGFGAAGGVAYAAALGKLPLPPALKGSVWGLTVWLCSYLGWIPATNVLPPATQHSKRRNFLMIAAHLVWGVSMAYLTEGLTRDAKEASKERASRDS